MSEATLTNVQAFMPFDGGAGVRLSVTDTSGNAPIPGTQGTDRDKLRIVCTNGGAVSAFVRLGQEGIIATLNSMEILPRTQVLLSPPNTNPSGLWVAAITESGSTSIQVTAGNGT